MCFREEMEEVEKQKWPFTGALGTVGQEGHSVDVKHMQSAGGRVLPLLGKGSLASRHTTSQTFERLADTRFSGPRICFDSWTDPDAQPGWRAQRARHFSVRANPRGSCSDQVLTPEAWRA